MIPFERFSLLIYFLGIAQISMSQLEYQQFIQDGEGSYFLEGCQSAVLTEDGQYLYVASRDDDAVVLFQRAPFTGNLTFLMPYVDGGNGGDFLSGVSALKIHPNAVCLVALSYEDQALNRFEINSDGALTLSQTTVYGGIIEGLRSPVDLAFSPDGTSL